MSNTRRAKTQHRGPTRVTADFLLNLIAYNVGPELKTTPEAAQGRPFEVDRTRLELSPTAACDPWRKSVTGQKNIPSKAAEVIFHLFGLGDYTVALVWYPFFCTERFHDLVRRHPPQIDRQSRGRSKRVSVTSSSISSARAQSAQKTFVLIGGAFYGAWCWHRVTERLEKQATKSMR